MNEKREPFKPALITLILRMAGGGYLVYLGGQMLPELSKSFGVRNLVQTIAMILFFAVGILLVGWSGKKLLQKEFVRPGEEETEG